MADTESHGPTEEVLEAFIEAYYKHSGPGHRAAVTEALNAVTPLIRERVCQELAEALRERAGAPPGISEYREGYYGAAEFVEQFGTDRGGEDG